MNLVGRSKLLAYIEKEPEAKTDLLIWMKGFAANEEKRYLEKGHLGTSHGTSQPGVGKYIIRYSYNGELKIGVIDFVGNKQDLDELRAKEHLIMIARSPESTFTLTTVTVMGRRKESVTVPINPSADDLNAGAKYLEEIANHPYNNFKYSPGFTIETKQDYEKALYRVIALFEIPCELPDLTEAAALIPLLKEYEERHLRFPGLDLVEVLKREMNIRQEQPIQLARLFGSEEDVLLFLSGKKAIRKKIVKALCKRYRIDFIYDELLESAMSSGLVS